jgi:hypothetical protein
LILGFRPTANPGKPGQATERPKTASYVKDLGLVPPGESRPATGGCRLAVAGKMILRQHGAEGNIVETDFLLRRR